MARVIVFGTKDTASLAHYYLREDSPHEVVAFAAHRDHLLSGAAEQSGDSGSEQAREFRFEGLPLVAFEDVETLYPPDDFSFFAPMTYRGMNGLRADVYAAVKAKGYHCISYVSSRATVFPNAEIGENCFILEDNTVQPFTPIGNNVVLWSGNHIGHHGRIRDHAFFTSHVVLSGHCDVGERSFFGVNATIRDGVTLGEGTLVGMGACVLKDTQPWGVYTGNPARLGPKPSHDLGI